MAAPTFPSPTRQGYLSLLYAMNELRSKTLKNHISNGRFYNQPLTAMVRDMHLLLQSKDPNRKFPQTLRKEDVPEYFERLLNEVNSATKHDYYGKIELGIRQGKWVDLPVPSSENTQPATPPPPASEEKTSDNAENDQAPETLAKHKAESARPFKGGGTKKEEPTSEKTEEKNPEIPPAQKLTRWQTVKSWLTRSQSPSPFTPAAPMVAATSTQSFSRRAAITGRAKQIGRGVTSALSSPMKNLGTQALIQIIRHPSVKTRALSMTLGAAGGYMVGGASGAGIMAVLVGIWGPQMSSQIGSYLTGGRSNTGGNTFSDNDDEENDRPDGGGGGGGRRRSIGRNRLQNEARKLAIQSARRALLASRTLFMTPWFWGVVGGAIVIIIVFLMVTCMIPFASCDGSLTSGDLSKEIQIQKTAPSEVENGAIIEYKITVTNKGSNSANIIVTDDIPADTVYKSGDNDPVPDATNVKKIQWDIKNLAAGQSKTLSFQVTPQKNDTWVINQAKGTAQFNNSSSGGDVPIPGNTPPTADNCNGTYPLKNPIGNFGDPKCDFKKDDLYQMLEQLDPANANIWFLEVARCESNYSPNAYADPIAVGTPDSAGAWGLFQMGRGKNGELDHGDVIWQLQASNAVNYSKKIPNKWGYWQCANHRW